MGAMGDIIASGKASYWGFSNHRAWQVGELVHLCDKLGTPWPVVAQPLYNLVNRQPESDLLPALRVLRNRGRALFAAGPRRAHRKNTCPEARRPRKAARGGATPASSTATCRKEAFRVVSRIRRRIAGRGMTVADFAMRWLLNNRLVSSVIAGPRTVAQWEAYLAALDSGFTASDEAFADRLVAPGHPATPGYTWPRYPVQGRRPVVA